MRILQPAEILDDVTLSIILSNVLYQLRNSPLAINQKCLCSQIQIDYMQIVYMKSAHRKEESKRRYHAHQIRGVVQKIIDFYPAIRIYKIKSGDIKVRFNKTTHFQLEKKKQLSIL